MNNFETQYLNITKKILDDGIDRPDRTGIGSRAIWGATMDIDLSEGFPITTTRKTSARIAFEESWFFLRGQTDTKILEDKKINIWKGNTTREFLDSKGLHDLPVGSIGKGYSHQWRNFGGDLGIQNGVDQVKNLIDGLQNDPNSRRHIISGWNPQQLEEMSLPACHLYNQYQVLDGKLNSSFVMRSNDYLYGNPFNVMGYALLNIAIAKLLKLESGHLTYFGNDVHLYLNQIEVAKEQVLREPYDLPTMILHKDINSFDDLLNIEWSDWELVGYKAHPDFKNKPPMAV